MVRFNFTNLKLSFEKSEFLVTGSGLAEVEIKTPLYFASPKCYNLSNGDPHYLDETDYDYNYDSVEFAGDIDELSIEEIELVSSTNLSDEEIDEIINELYTNAYFIEAVENSLKGDSVKWNEEDIFEQIYDLVENYEPEYEPEYND